MNQDNHIHGTFVPTNKTYRKRSTIRIVNPSKCFLPLHNFIKSRKFVEWEVNVQHIKIADIMERIKLFKQIPETHPNFTVYQTMIKQLHQQVDQIQIDFDSCIMAQSIRGANDEPFLSICFHCHASCLRCGVVFL